MSEPCRQTHKSHITRLAPSGSHYVIARGILKLQPAQRRARVCACASDTIVYVMEWEKTCYSGSSTAGCIMSDSTASYLHDVLLICRLGLSVCVHMCMHSTVSVSICVRVCVVRVRYVCVMCMFTCACVHVRMCACSCMHIIMCV